MNLRAKILIILAAAFLLVAAAEYEITRVVVLGSFERLEQDLVRVDVERVRNAIKEDLEALSSTAGDWAAWDETRDFVLGKAPTYGERNLTVSSLANLRPNFMVFLDKGNRPLRSVGMDPAKKEIVQVPADILQAALDQKSFLRHSGPADGKKVLALFGKTPALVVAWPVTNNEMNGPIVGTLIVGRYFDKPYIDGLSVRTQLSLQFSPARYADMPKDFAAAVRDLTLDSGPKAQVAGENLICGYTLLGDIDHRLCLAMRVDKPRDIYKRGLASARYFTVALLAIGALLLAGAYVVAQYFIVGPVTRLTQHVSLIGRTGDLSRTIDLPSHDEIGVLAREFNAMVAKLADARNRLLEQSYYSGVAEMATNVLHSVRNSLMPILAVCETTRQKLRGAAPEKLQQALEELDRPETTPERAEKLNRYVQLSAARMPGLLRESDEEIGAVVDGIAKIEENLNEQDQFSHAERVLEPVSLKEALQSAAAAMPGHLRNWASIDLDSALSDLPAVRAERVSLTQILSVLLNNAAEAIARQGRRGRILASGSVESQSGSNRVHLRIEDNGCGIDAASLPRVFERGFPASKGKHSGLGLHWSANVIAAMNWEIHAESAGPGQGACFHLTIPVS